MVSEHDVRTRLEETAAQLQSLGLTIRPLQDQARSGAPGWQLALEQLAGCYRRRRDLEAQRASLEWVLAHDQDKIRPTLAT
jgi:hypothetical protein